MQRKDKYPDTDVFHLHNANPKRRYTCDCAARAISIALELPYSTVVKGLADVQCETGYADTRLIEKYLILHGWVKHAQPKTLDNKKFTAEEFCVHANLDHNYVVSVGSHHLTAVVAGKIHDTWDCSGKRVGVFYTPAGKNWCNPYLEELQSL